VSRPLGKGAQVSQETANRTFDELTRGLASGTLSRSKALKLMGAAILGGTLAARWPPSLDRLGGQA